MLTFMHVVFYHRPNLNTLRIYYRNIGNRCSPSEAALTFSTHRKPVLRRSDMMKGLKLVFKGFAKFRHCKQRAAVVFRRIDLRWVEKRNLGIYTYF